MLAMQNKEYKTLRKEVLSFIELFIHNIIRMTLNAFNNNMFIAAPSRLDVQNYFNVHGNELNLSVNEFMNIVHVYHMHMAFCNIYLRNKIYVRKNISYSKLKHISKYDQNKYYIVYDPYKQVLLKKILEQHENL